MNIPQELIDKIIDEVWDADDSPYHTTTKAVSLISRAWVERSQHHLFHDVQFSVHYDVELSVHCDDFLHWCDTVSPGPDGLSRHVRSLTIEAREWDGWWIGEELLERGLPFFDSFRNVRVLRVQYWDINPFHPEVLTRCFAPFSGTVRVLQWDPYVGITRESWTRVVRFFPLVDCLLLKPKYFPTGLLSNTPPGPTQKKLVLSGNRAIQCLTWDGGNLRFREIYIKCGPHTTLETLVAIFSREVDRLEVLSIAGIGNSWSFSVLRFLILNPLL